MKTSNGHVSDARIAMTAVNPAPVLVPQAAEMLIGNAVTEALAEAAGDAAARTAKPLTTSALTPEYRRETVSYTHLDMPHSTVNMKIDRDGGVVVYTGASDIGQGSDTMTAQIAAEVLGCSLSRVRIIAADTDLTPVSYTHLRSTTNCFPRTSIPKNR